MEYTAARRGFPPRCRAAAEPSAGYLVPGRSVRGAGWHAVPAVDLPRRPQDVFVEPIVRDALIRLNPAIAAQPERAGEVLYKMCAHAL